MDTRLALAIAKQLSRNNKYAESEIVDYLQAVPFAGGLLHGIARPAQGNSRLESGVVQGTTGLAGGIAGGTLGGVAGGFAGNKLHEILRDNQPGRTQDELQQQQQKLIAIGALLGVLMGGSTGTAAGSAAGRFVSKREVMTPADWVQLAEATRRQPASPEIPAAG
jgi:hypothetical protein